MIGKLEENFFCKVTNPKCLVSCCRTGQKKNPQRECSTFEYLVSIYFYLLWWVDEDNLCSLLAVVGGATVGEGSLRKKRQVNYNLGFSRIFSAIAS
jgi:hypothetical protein